MSGAEHRHEPCTRDPQCVYFKGHKGPHGYPSRVVDRSYREATADVDWRLVGEAPVVDLQPCVCGEERVDAVPDGFRCVACGVVRRSAP